MQACNMDERTNEEVLKEKTPEILWPAIRQYRPQTGIGFQCALDIGETVKAVEALQQRNAELEGQLRAANEANTQPCNVSVPEIKSEAIREAIQECSVWSDFDEIHRCDTDKLKAFADNLTKAEEV